MLRGTWVLVQGKRARAEVMFCEQSVVLIVEFMESSDTQETRQTPEETDRRKGSCPKGI
jgi:hypothetical protein